MAQLAHYDDVVAEVRRELSERIDAALTAGVDAARIVIDPGLGFAKNAEHNWALLAHLDSLIRAGFPGARRRVPQVFPRLACWPAPTAPAAGRPARGRHDGAVDVRGRARVPGESAYTGYAPTADAVRVAAAIRGATAIRNTI